jgi:ComF family protein
VRPLAGEFCSICGETLSASAFVERGDALCGICQRVQPPFQKALAYGSYDGGLRELIHLLKYQQVRPAAGVLGRTLAEVIEKLTAGIPEGMIAVVPVPLYARKQAQRGFNQAEVIARIAVKQLARPKRFRLCAGVLKRRRETASQIGLTGHQRQENVRGAFAVPNPGTMAGRQVVLVDDVFTTGATVSECAQVLRRAGAGGVWVATVARTLKIAEVFAMPEDLTEEEESGVRRVVAAHG